MGSELEAIKKRRAKLYEQPDGTFLPSVVLVDVDFLLKRVEELEAAILKGEVHDENGGYTPLAQVVWDRSAQKMKDAMITKVRKIFDASGAKPETRDRFVDDLEKVTS